MWSKDNYNYELFVWSTLNILHSRFIPTKSVIDRVGERICTFLESNLWAKEAWLVQNDTIESCSAEYSELLCVQLLLEPCLRNWHVLSFFDRVHHFFYIKSLRKGFSTTAFLLLQTDLLFSHDRDKWLKKNLLLGFCSVFF